MSFLSASYEPLDPMLMPLEKVFRDQEINIHEQLELARHFGPLHRHATTPIPRNGLEEVHGQFEPSHNMEIFGS